MKGLPLAGFLSFKFLTISRFSAEKVYITASVKLGEKGDKIDVKDLDLALKLSDIHIEMECLFPKYYSYIIQ